MVAYRLRNQENPERSLGITIDTWFKILNLAEVHGWRSFSISRTGTSHYRQPSAGYYLGKPLVVVEESSGEKIATVVMEDALNLADTLERAFLAYDPIYLPAQYFYFQNREIEDHLLPSIGAIREIIEFCKLGSFWIEPFRDGFHNA